MRRLLPFLLAVPFLVLTAPARAATLPDFDRGITLHPLVQQAMDVAVPGVSAPTPAISPAAAPETVWISILTQDVTALGEEFNFPERKPAGQNGVLSVYELRAAELDRLGDIMQRKFRRSPGFFAHSSLRSAQQDFTLPPLAAAAAYTIDQGEKVSTMLQLVDESSITGMISTLSAYKTRYYRSVTGIAAPKWLYGYWTQLAAGRPDISVATFRHSAFPQESVILTVTGAVEPEKVIVIGGHIDCTSGGADNPAPGADDNASGIAVTNEVLRVLIASGYRPAQTLKFMAFAAEEAGLRGSAEIAAAFKKQGVAVQGMLNLDMANFKGSAQDINFVTDNTNSDQNAFLGKLVDIYTPYTWATFKCGYGCSDHASWTKNGYPASLPFESKMEEYNPAIHTANDTLEQMGGRATHAVKFAKLAVAYMVELAK